MERVGTGQRDQHTGVALASNLAQGTDGFGQRKLFASEAGNKTATADLAARLELAIDIEQLTPGRQPIGLSFEQAPEHHAIAAQQGACHMLNCLGTGSRRVARGAVLRKLTTARERPSAGDFHAEWCRLAPGPQTGTALAPLGRHEQRPQAAKAVGPHQSQGNQLGERILNLGAQQTGPVDQLLEEGCPGLPKEVSDRPRWGR